jgi:hypothetical protein
MKKLASLTIEYLTEPGDLYRLNREASRAGQWTAKGFFAVHPESLWALRRVLWALPDGNGILPVWTVPVGNEEGLIIMGHEVWPNTGCPLGELVAAL